MDGKRGKGISRIEESFNFGPNLKARRSESAQLYRKSIGKLANNRDQYLRETAIGRGDLVM